MEMNAEQIITATREKVWDALNDPEVLKKSIPGCESFEEDGENSFRARITTKVGPVKASFNFSITLSDLNPPESYTINGEGQGGPAGFANGSAAVSLTEEGENTVLAYKVEAHIGGKLMQLGARLIDATANKLAAEFFDNFSAIVADQSMETEDGHVPEESDVNTESSNERKKSIPFWIWPVVMAVIIFVGYQIFA